MAGPLSRRDIEMIFRAETDKAQRPVQALTKDVKALRQSLEDQVGAVEKTEASFDSLAATTRDLKKAQDEIGTARGLLTQLNAQDKALQSAEERLAGATAKYTDLAAKIAAAEQPTKRLTQQFEAAGRAQAAAAESLDRVKAEATETRAQIEAIIGPVSNTADAFREIATTSRDISRGLAVAGQAAEDFKTHLAGVSAEQAKLASDKSFQQAGQDAGLLQAQINYISQFENRVQLLAQAKAELAAQSAGFDKALQAQDAKVGAANVAELQRAFEATAASEAQLKQVTAFRQIAADANAALADVARFGVAEDQAAASTTRLGDALLAILNPTRSASASIDGMEASVTAAAGVLEGKGTKSANEYAAAMATLGEAAVSVGRIASQIDGFVAQQAAVAKAGATFEQYRTDALAAAAAIEASDAPTQEMVNDLKKLQTASDLAGKEFQNESTKLAAMSVKLRQAGVDTNDLAGAEKRLTAVAKETAVTQAAISNKTGGKGGLFGLTPNDATNLGYQINDIFTQLASGQSIFTTLAQQGPQIWQIGGVRAFLGALGPLLPILALVAAAVALVAAAISRMNFESNEAKASAAYIAMIGEAGSLTADQMTKASIAMQDFGISAKDAHQAVQEFSQAGLDPAYLEAYTKAAQDAALVTGNDFSSAFKLLTDAMTGGKEQIDALLAVYPVLSDAERINIDDMIDQGKVSEARRIVYEKFAEHMDKAARAGGNGGDWSNAWQNLKSVFRNFLDVLVDAPIAIGGVITSIRGMTQSINEGLKGLNYLLLRAKGLSAAQASIAAYSGNGRAPAAPGPKGGAGPAAQPPKITPLGQRAIKQAKLDALPKKDQTKKQRGDVAYQQAYNAALDKQYSTEEAISLAVIARDKAQRDFQDGADKRAATAGRRADAAARRDENAAKALAARIQAQQESLETALDQMGAKVAKSTAGNLQDQLTAAATAVRLQYEKLFRQLDDYAKLTNGKGKVGNQTIAQAKAQIAANETILTQQAQLKVYEDTVNDTLKQRAALLADIEDQAARGEISGAEAIQKTAEVTSKFDPLIQNLATAAANFAASIAGANPSPELQAFIAKMKHLGSANSGDDQSVVKKSADANIGREEAKLNDILAQRNALVETYNALVEMGAMTAGDARTKSAAAYAEAQTAITAQTAALRAAIESSHSLGVMNDLTYNAWIAKLGLVGQQAVYVDPRLKEVKSSIDGLITQNAMAAIDKIAQAFGNLVAGTESFGSAIKDAALAFLGFIGDTIIGIAKLILQMIILDAVQKITGIPVGALLRLTGGGGLTGAKHNGGTIGSYSGGQQTTTRSISPMAIAMAPRYHDGTPGVGLKPNEQVAVLERGEKVTTEEQQRQEAAAAKRGGGNGKTPLRQVLAFGDDQVAAAMAGPAGEDVTVTHIRRNVPLLKQLLG